MTESRTVEADPARFRRHLGRGVPFPAWGSKKAHTWSTKGGEPSPGTALERIRESRGVPWQRGTVPVFAGRDDVPVGDEDGRLGERV